MYNLQQPLSLIASGGTESISYHINLVEQAISAQESYILTIEDKYKSLKEIEATWESKLAQDQKLIDECEKFISKIQDKVEGSNLSFSYSFRALSYPLGFNELKPKEEIQDILAREFKSCHDAHAQAQSVLFSYNERLKELNEVLKQFKTLG